MDQQTEITSLPERMNEKVGTHFHEHGLQVDIMVIDKLSPLHLREFPRGSLIGEMHFRPKGRTFFREDRISESLLLGIEGFQRLFNQIDQNQFKRPDYLYGQTSEKMAKQAQLLGFQISKANYTDLLDPIGTIGAKSGGDYEIVAETDTVRSKLKELLERQYPGGKTIIEVLRERSTLQLSPQQSPKHLFRRLVDTLSMKRKPPKNH